MAVLREMLERLLRQLDLIPGDRRIFALDEQLAEYVHALAERERRPPGEVAADLLASGMAQRDLAEEVWRRWQTLTPREQQVAALVCLDYTNRQIAGRLDLAVDTVKTHVRNAEHKLDLRSKAELRAMFAGWDFSAWEQ
jgi:DNA-binding CsgD family transcriptional regulator